MRRAFKYLFSLYRKVKKSSELSKYNEFTRAEYFRKQGAQIGERCSIIPTSIGTEPYLIKIGHHVTIAQGVTFVTHDGATWILRDEHPNIQGFGPIIIEDNCVIGMHSVLFPNIKIGRNSIVGAGSVVVTDVPPDTIVMGIPARPLGSVEKYKEKCVKRWKNQLPPDINLEEGETWWSSKHYTENRQKLKKHLLALYGKELGLNNETS